jgi:carbamoyltransferase
MLILGLNAFHADSSAALVRDGKLVAAAEEERFRRIKHWAGFPSQAIAYCLSEAGIRLSDVDHVAFNQDSRANLLRKIRYTLLNRPSIDIGIKRSLQGAFGISAICRRQIVLHSIADSR